MSILCENFYCVVSATFAALVVSLHFYVKYLYSYWDRRGIRSLSPTFPFGNLWKVVLMRSSMAEMSKKLYNSTSDAMIGVYSILRPVIVIRDPNLIQKILVKDFTHFPNRGVYYDEEKDPLSAHLFAIEGQKWKTLRTKLSPTFTSGKLKAMIPAMVSCCEILEKHLAEKVKSHESIEIRELSASHSTNVIASVAFGIDIDCINEPNVDFRYHFRKHNKPTLRTSIKHVLKFLSPEWMKLLGIKWIDDDFEKFMMSIVKENMELREQNGIVRKDFFQLLIQLRNGIDVGPDDQWKSTKRTDGKYDLTMEELTAQAFVFFAAGFETSSTTLSWFLYELAVNQDIQNRVHYEIDEVLRRHNGEFNYESLSELKYMDMCIDGELTLANY